MIYDIQGKTYYMNEPENATIAFLNEYYHENATDWKINAIKNNDLLNGKYIIENGRMTGKTDLIMKMILGIIHSNQNKNILVVSAQSFDYLPERFVDIFNELARTFHMPKIISSRKSEIKFSNGNTIYFMNVANRSFRGLNINHVFIDEILFMDSKNLGEFLAGVIPTRPQSILGVSTPSSNSLLRNKLKIGFDIIRGGK